MATNSGKRALDILDEDLYILDSQEQFVKPNKIRKLDNNKRSCESSDDDIYIYESDFSSLKESDYNGELRQVRPKKIQKLNNIEKKSRKRAFDASHSHDDEDICILETFNSSNLNKRTCLGLNESNKTSSSSTDMSEQLETHNYTYVNHANIKATTSKKQKPHLSQTRLDNQHLLNYNANVNLINSEFKNFDQRLHQLNEFFLVQNNDDNDKQELMFEGVDLLKIKGHRGGRYGSDPLRSCISRYSCAVARVLWSDPDSLWYNRIVDPGQKNNYLC